MSEQVISRVLFPSQVTLCGIMAIHLPPILLLGSSNLPMDSGGQPSNVHLFGLAPGGVYPATAVTSSAVRSYRTFSPLPDHRGDLRPCVFCGTFPGIAAGGC